MEELLEKIKEILKKTDNVFEYNAIILIKQVVETFLYKKKVYYKKREKDTINKLRSIPGGH